MPASGGLSLMELRGVDAKPLAQNLVGVLSQQWRRHPDRARSAVDLPRCAHLRDPARLRMVDLHRHVALPRGWAGKCFFDVEARTRRDPELLESLEPARTSAFPQMAFDGAFEL